MPTTTALDASVRELTLLDDAFVRCVRQRDAARLVDCCYAMNSQLHTAGTAPWAGRDSVQSFWAAMFLSGLIDCRRESTHVEMEHELAWSAGRYQMTMETHPGMLQVERGKYLTVYRRQADGAWRMLAESLSRNE